MRSVVSYCPSMLIFPTNWTYTLILCVCTMFHKKGDTQAVTEIDHGFSHRVIIRLIITPWLQRFRIPFFCVRCCWWIRSRYPKANHIFHVYCLQRFPLCVPVTHYESICNFRLCMSTIIQMENFGYLYSIAVAAGGVAGYVRKGNNRVAKQSAVYCSLPCHTS